MMSETLNHLIGGFTRNASRVLYESKFEKKSQPFRKLLDRIISEIVPNLDILRCFPPGNVESEGKKASLMNSKDWKCPVVSELVDVGTFVGYMYSLEHGIMRESWFSVGF